MIGYDHACTGRNTLIWDVKLASSHGNFGSSIAQCKSATACNSITTGTHSIAAEMVCNSVLELRQLNVQFSTLQVLP
jgi:hypothetical protein